jgi:hypothetical protein
LYDKLESDWGHVLVIEKYANDLITLVDPSAKHNYETFALEKVIKAIKKHGVSNMGGFWLIKRI